VILGLAFATHSLYNTSKDYNALVGRGVFVAGPMAHTLSLESEYYPILYGPRLRGLSVINQQFDARLISYQIIIPGIANWAPLGLGLDSNPELVAVHEIFPRPTGIKYWRLELYRLRASSTTEVHSANNTSAALP